MSHSATPRVHGEYLQNFINGRIIIIGRVTQVLGEQAVIESKGDVKLHLTKETRLVAGRWFEIIGKVQPDLSIKVLNSTDFGTNIDVAAVDSVVEATHKHKEIFYSDSQC